MKNQSVGRNAPWMVGIVLGLLGPLGESQSQGETWDWDGCEIQKILPPSIQPGSFGIRVAADGPVLAISSHDLPGTDQGAVNVYGLDTNGKWVWDHDFSLSTSTLFGMPYKVVGAERAPSSGQDVTDLDGHELPLPPKSALDSPRMKRLLEQEAIDRHRQGLPPLESTQSHLNRCSDPECRFVPCLERRGELYKKRADQDPRRLQLWPPSD